MTKNLKGFKVQKLRNSIKFYLPRIEGYLEVVKKLSGEFEGMTLIEFDGYFEKENRTHKVCSGRKYIRID